MCGEFWRVLQRRWSQEYGGESGTLYAKRSVTVCIDCLSTCFESLLVSSMDSGIDGHNERCPFPD